jgi:two-component system, NarL family, response regulator DevR
VKRIYVVDDSALIRDRLIEMLSDIPDVQVVGQSADPREAAANIRATSPDVVILDIQMQGKNGIELLKEIKQEAPGIRVIVLTSYVYPQYRRQCKDLGAEHFLSKLTEVEKLRGLVQNMDDRNVMTKERSRKEA